MHRLSTYSCFALIILFGSGCRSGSDSMKLAEVDGIAITQGDLDRTSGKALSIAREQLYKLERQKLEEHIGATLLTQEAKHRNVSVSTLLDQEVNAKVQPVTEEEIQKFYDSHKDRLPTEFAKVHDQIRNFLIQQRAEKQKAEFFHALRSKAKVTTYLKPPPIFRAEVATNGAPFRGNAGATITVVKFEDYQCPFCKNVQPTFQEVLKKYNGKVRLVHKDLPLEAIHPQAWQAAEAGRCAGEQGKFWEYHDKLYAASPKLGTDELKSAAKDVGLNATTFDQCLASGKYKAAVQKDVNEAAQLGLTGTPAFFINGREMSGAQPLEAFAAIIDEELGQAK